MAIEVQVLVQVIDSDPPGAVLVKSEKSTAVIAAAETSARDCAVICQARMETIVQEAISDANEQFEEMKGQL